MSESIPRGSVPVSVMIPAKNEIANIRACIESVAFASEIVVVDSSSVDGTREEAERIGARVVDFAWNGKFPKKKNWALANVEWRNDWVLILDADERIVPPLAAEIARALADPSKDGWYINRRFMFAGGWIRHCGYYPSWNLRLFRHALGRYERLEDVGDTGSGDNEVHEHVVMDESRVGRLGRDMLHYAYPSVDAWLEKHHRYSNWEARVRRARRVGGDRLRATPFGHPLQRRRWLKNAAGRLPFRAFVRFVYHYVFRLGFLDGRRGLVLCVLIGFYEFLSGAKEWELDIREPKARKEP